MLLFCGLPFCFLYHTVLILMKSTLFFLLLAFAFGVLFKEPLPNPMSNTVLSLLIGPGNFVKNQLAINVGFVSGFSILFHWPKCLLVLVPHCHAHCCLVVSFETVSFFFKIVLAFPGPLHFHVNFRISLSISTNKAAGIMKGTIESVGCFGEYTVLNNIKSSNPCPQIRFPLFSLSLILTVFHRSQCTN